MAESGNMRWFLVCIVLQTVLLFILFRPDQSKNAPPMPYRDDREVLQQALIQLAHTLNHSLSTQQKITQMYNTQGAASQTDLQTIRKFFTQLVTDLSPSNSNSNSNSVQVTEKEHIKNTHPDLMRYRYALADPSSNLGPLKDATLQASFVLLEEYGKRFWAKKTYMIEWVYDETGRSGEYNVRVAFNAVLGKRKPINLVLDVGSNTGLFSMISAVYGAKRVYAFDPQPLCAQYVAESAQINGFGDRVAVINAFVSKDETITAPIPENQCSGEFNVDTGKGFNKTVNIHAVNLDTHFLTEPDDIDLMKVDVEGAELIVLAGARELFAKHRVRNLIIELTPGWWPTNFNTSYEKGISVIKDILFNPGYKVWELPYHHEAPIFLANWTALELSMRPPGDWHNQKNYLFSLEDIFDVRF